MARTVFTPQIIPAAPATSVYSSNPLLPIRTLNSLPTAVPKRRSLAARVSSSLVDGDLVADSISRLERCFLSDPASVPFSSASEMSYPVMKGKYGSVGAVTLEKAKLDISKKESKFSAETATGGGGGDAGKNINMGGGDGGNDDGDDDDYIDDFDDGDEGDEGGLFRRRLVLEELFDRKFVDAVLNEWQRTMMDLPAGLRQACEMGLVSSAQLVKFLAINARPTAERFISRALPQGVSRAFIGRMIADPAFAYRLLLEQVATIGCSVWWELKNRRGRIKQEWHLVLTNVLTVSACNAFVVWSLAPCRSYGNTFRYDLQNTLQKLPNNIFEKSYPQREFDMQKRISSFFCKAAELCMVGLISGAAQGAFTNYVASKKKDRLSVTVPTVGTNALGYGAFLGLYSNLRYQLLCGLDRAMMDRFDVIGVTLFISTALRIANVQLGEASRRAWLGVEADPLAKSDSLLNVYNRPSEGSAEPSSRWFESGLRLLGIKQGTGDEKSSPPPKARRKRVIRKKVAEFA